MSSNFQPKPNINSRLDLDVGNRGRDPFGEAVRETSLRSTQWKLLARWGIRRELHDNDLVPIDASASERDAIVSEFHKACDDNNIKVPMATVNFLRCGVSGRCVYANDAKVRSYAVRKQCRQWISCGIRLLRRSCFVGGREGVETDACRGLTMYQAFA
jgi:xylose isomerase